MPEIARVLVVDDNEMNRDMLSRRLKRRGYSVEVAEDGTAALAAIADGTFDVVLLDVMMPGLSGYDVLERVRKRHTLAELPVIMATSKDRSEDVVHALRLGANDYITKPVDFDVLTARLETQLAMKRQAITRAAGQRGNTGRESVPTSRASGETTLAPQFERIARYEIIQLLGHGGMGSVYLARDPALGRLVAIKLIRAGLDDPERRERFASEARSAAQLAHPNIVTIFDVGEHDSQPYMAMEFVPGETLAAIIARGEDRLPAWKLAVMQHLCAGLAHAHHAGIVHRDIKPSNVMIAPDGGVKILDFGIARRTDSDITRTGAMLGTLNYMAPEQLSGGTIDPRTDIFALGALFYELLAFQRAFPGTVQDGLLTRILMSDPPPLKHRRPELDARLVAAIDQALQREPARRQQDVDEIRRVLLIISDDLTVRPGSSSAPVQ